MLVSNLQAPTLQLVCSLWAQWEGAPQGLGCSLHFFLSFFNIFIYLSIWLCQLLVAARRIFSCGMQTFSHGMWDLVP